MLTGRGVVKESSSTVLDVLQPVDVLVRCSHKKGAAVVQAGGYESVDEALCARLWEAAANLSNIPQMEKGNFCIMLDVSLK